MAVEIGQAAPSFSLANIDRKMFDSESLKGKKSLVVFIPNPFTGVCDGEVCEIRDNMAQLASLDANVVVITTHGRATNEKWVETEGLKFPVLSDFWPHGEVSEAYGTFNEKFGIAMRSTYVLDADGIVRDIVATESLGDPRSFADYADALAAID
ncbi:MAG: redoxin domain-containing protein [Acidimicrobiia bacterium]|nr:redoxin domain-containing protein [Acidimicrobiia bacterium]